MKFAVAGAGAIGGYVGACLARAGADVTLFARGPHLQAMQERGLRVMSEDGDFEVQPNVTGDLSSIADADVIFLGVKAHALTELAPRLAPLMAPSTVVISMQNGLPWWYFQQTDGPHAGIRLQCVDPGGVIARSFAPDRVIGSIAYFATTLEAPGVIRHVEGNRLTLGEPDGRRSERCRQIAEALIAGGLRAKITTRIRHEIWVKLLGNASLNPVSALTGATLAEIVRDPNTGPLIRNLMTEVEAVARRFGIELPISIEQRMAGAEKAGQHKTSMLQDLESKRPLELDEVVGAVIELGERFNLHMPATRAVYACAKLLDRRNRPLGTESKEMRLNTRWFQMAAVLIAMIMIANLQYGWTLFVRPIEQDHGWSLAKVQWAFTLFILFQTWVQPLDGWLIDRLGPRIFVPLGAILSGLGWTALAFVTTLTQLYAAYAVAGAGSALVYSGSIGSTMKWFRDRRGLAAGVIAGGYGAGAALFIPIIARLITAHGYRAAFVWTGIVPGLIILAIAQVVRHPPADDMDMTLARASAPKKKGPVRRNRESFSTDEMLRTPQFYLLYVMLILMATGGLLVTAQAGPVAASFGLPIAALTMATALSPLANGSSRLFWGWVSDHFGRENTMAIAFSLNALALISVITVGRRSGALFSATLVLTFFTWGETFALFPSTLADWFGARHSTSNYAFLYTAKGIASILGGGVAALMFQHFGSWSSAFYGSAAFALAAGVLAFVLRAVPLPRKKAPPLATASVAL